MKPLSGRPREDQYFPTPPEVQQELIPLGEACTSAKAEGEPDRNEWLENPSLQEDQDTNFETFKKGLESLKLSLENVRASLSKESKFQSHEPEPTPTNQAMAGPEPQTLPPPHQQIDSPGGPQHVEFAHPEVLPQMRETSLPQDPPATCSGRLHLVFVPSLDMEKLGFFWQIIDEIIGFGKLIDARPLAKEDGFEFVVDLDDEVLVVEELKRRTSSSEITFAGSNTLHIRWATD